MAVLSKFIVAGSCAAMVAAYDTGMLVKQKPSDSNTKFYKQRGEDCGVWPPGSASNTLRRLKLRNVPDCSYMCNKNMNALEGQTLQTSQSGEEHSSDQETTDTNQSITKKAIVQNHSDKNRSSFNCPKEDKKHHVVVVLGPTGSGKSSVFEKMKDELANPVAAVRIDDLVERCPKFKRTMINFFKTNALFKSLFQAQEGKDEQEFKKLVEQEFKKLVALLKHCGDIKSDLYGEFPGNTESELTGVKTTFTEDEEDDVRSAMDYLFSIYSVSRSTGGGAAIRCSKWGCNKIIGIGNSEAAWSYCEVGHRGCSEHRGNQVDGHWECNHGRFGCGKKVYEMTEQDREQAFADYGKALKDTKQFYSQTNGFSKNTESMVEQYWTKGRTCDEMHDAILRENLENEPHVLFETTGDSYPDWLVTGMWGEKKATVAEEDGATNSYKFLGAEKLKNRYQCTFIRTHVEINELRKRILSRFLNGLYAFLLDYTTKGDECTALPPRLPNYTGKKVSDYYRSLDETIKKIKTTSDGIIDKINNKLGWHFVSYDNSGAPGDAEFRRECCASVPSLKSLFSSKSGSLGKKKPPVRSTTLERVVLKGSGGQQ